MNFALWSEILFIVDEIKDVRMWAGEFIFYLLAERVMPDYPVAHKKTKLVGYDFYVGGVLISYGYIKWAVRFEDFLAACHPIFCPGDIVFVFYLVVVFVVFVADIKGWVGKN